MANEEAKSILGKMLSATDLDKLDQGNPDLDRAFKILSAKLPGYNNLWNYYDGNQPLMYTASRMRDLFASLDLATFVENWCSVVIDAANDRINLSSVSVKTEADNKDLEQAWITAEAGLEASDVHEAALVIGESYLIVWPNDEDNESDLDLFYNDPRLVHLFYEPGNPRKKWYGAKWWIGSDNHLRMTLYYPDVIKYYRSTKQAKNVASSKGLVPYSPDGIEGGAEAVNEYGAIPIFHFQTERRKVKGDLVNAIPLQNAINKLVTDMMVAAEYGAFPQRWVISQANIKDLKNAPNELWGVPAGDGMGQHTSVGQFDATELNNYVTAIDHLATTMAIITRTPRHYLFQQGGDPSGEALIAMEAPLNKRCQDHIEKFTPTWKEVVQFVMLIRGKKVKREDIVITFDQPETIQPKTVAEIRNEGKRAGLPLKTLLREEGKDKAWIEQMEADKKEEEAETKSDLAAAILAGLRDSNQPDESETE